MPAIVDRPMTAYGRRDRPVSTHSSHSGFPKADIPALGHDGHYLSTTLGLGRRFGGSAQYISRAYFRNHTLDQRSDCFLYILPCRFTSQPSHTIIEFKSGVTIQCPNFQSFEMGYSIGRIRDWRFHHAFNKAPNHAFASVWHAMPRGHHGFRSRACAM